MVRLSADAIMFALRLLEEGGLGPAELAEHLRAVAAGTTDQLIALQERIMAQTPRLEALAARLAAETHLLPLDCPECRARFRVSPAQAEAASDCPLCGQPMEAGRRLLFLAAGAPARRAAEGEPVYETAHPRRLGHFELGRLLGRGGAGRVYEARNLHAGRTVALKVLDFRPLESAAEAFERLRREARTASSIVHENLVRVFDLGVAEGLSFIEMELVRGTSLAEQVRAEGPLPPLQAVRLCAETLAALARVHQGGIVHRDIKPGNILVDQEGRARLTDFGLSRLLEETTTLAGTDRVVGSPHFMAPEQWRGEAVSARTDLYATGLVLYFALTARLPYEGESLVSLMYRHLHDPLLRAGEPYPLPDYLCQVIRRATEKHPAARFESAEEFRCALLALEE